MLTITRREFFLFFNSGIGYLSMGIFLTINTLFLWFFDTNFNIINSGFADLNSFFILTPWLFMPLIPAIIMRSFSEERRLGTLELLLTKPLGLWQIILGKYLGGILLMSIALVSSFVHLFALNNLKLGDIPIDWGATFSGFMGLLFVGSIFVSIAILCSLLSKNQATAFMLAFLLCFVQFFLWKGIGDLMYDSESYNFFNQIGIYEHYLSLQQGLISIKDVVYFICSNYILLYLSRQVLLKIKNQGG